MGNLSGRVFVLGTWFFLTPFVLHRLGAVQYALWVISASLVAYGKVLDFGISSAVTKYVAEFRARGEIQKARSLVATALWLYCGLGALAIALGAVLAPIFPAVLNVPPSARSTAFWVVLVSGIVIGIQIPATTTYSVLDGLQRYDLTSLVQIVVTVLVAATTVAVLLLGGGVVGIIALYGPLAILAQLPLIALIRREEPQLEFGFRGAQRTLVGRVMSFSLALFVIRFAERIKTKTDEIVIGAFLPLATVAPYALVRQLSELPRIISEQFAEVLMPLASQLDAESDDARVRAVYTTSARISTASFVALGSVALVLAHPFLVVWVGARYARDSYLVLLLLGGSFFSAALWPASSILQGIARHRRLAVFSMASALVNLGLSIALVRPLGVKGVALGTLIATTVEVVFFVFPYAMRVIGVSPRTAVTEIFLPSVAPVVPELAALYGLRTLAKPTSLVSIASIALVGVAIYTGVYLLTCAGPGERYVARRIGSGGLELVRTATAHAAAVVARR